MLYDKFKSEEHLEVFFKNGKGHRRMHSVIKKFWGIHYFSKLSMKRYQEIKNRMFFIDDTPYTID
jgi:hypothetical protein